MTVPIVVADVWALPNDWFELSRAGILWQSILRQSDERLAAWDRQAAATVPAIWSGTAASAYASHRRRLTADVGAAQELADHVGKALTTSGEAVKATAEALIIAYDRLSAEVAVEDRPAPGKVVFRPADQAQAVRVRAAVADARRLREQLGHEITTQADVIRRTLARWQQIGDTWAGVAEGGDPFLVPDEASATVVLRDGNRVVVSTGAGDDQVRVGTDESGQQVVEVNGGRWLLAPDAELTVRTGDGNDTVEVAAGSRIKLTVLGGDGNDRLIGGDGGDRLFGLTGADQLVGGAGVDVLLGGGGNDYLAGGDGRDLIDGGWGDDAIYGMSGPDLLAGGEGRDYLDGGLGGDQVDGGAGADVVSGGGDDDRLLGGAGADVLYTGSGQDTVSGGAGTDTAYLASGASAGSAERQVTVELRHVGAEVRIDGSPAFVERVQADLDLLRASPTGQRMLAELDAGLGGPGTVDRLVITEIADDNGSADAAGRIGYNPAFHTLQGNTPPVAVLFHELAHAYDYTHGTVAAGVYDNPSAPDSYLDGSGQWQRTPNSERVAVGLPIDDDGDPSTPFRLDPDHPADLTENGLRAELGWPLRRRYGI